MKNSRRRGMTLLEVTLVSGLMTLLVVILSATWTGIGRPAMDLVIRTRVLREMSAAVDALARDLGGYLADPMAREGDIRQYRWIGWSAGEGELRLCYDAGNAFQEPNNQADWSPPDRIVIYEQDGENLLRTDHTDDKTIFIARYLTDFSVSEESGYIRLDLKFSHRGFERQCTLFIQEP